IQLIQPSNNTSMLGEKNINAEISQKNNFIINSSFLDELSLNSSLFSSSSFLMLSAPKNVSEPSDDQMFFFKFMGDSFIISENGKEILNYFKNITKKKFKILDFAKKDLEMKGYNFKDIKQFIMILEKQGYIQIKRKHERIIFCFTNKSF
ncbi:MAG: hypothetical protein KC414_14560, partial [Romboutsia sp.]|nr:hypothetical protein [Romboutsia sp.]